MGRDRCELMRNTYLHLMLMEAQAMRDGGWNLSPRAQSWLGNGGVSSNAYLSAARGV